MRNVDQRQVWSGLAFIGLGGLALLNLPAGIGTPSEMGPGYFPLLLGVCLMLLGVLSVVLGLRASAAVHLERLPVGTALSVTAGVIAFGLLIRPAGLAAALLALVLLSCWRRLRSQPWTVLLTYLGLLLLTWFAFIYVIQLPIEVIR